GGGCTRGANRVGVEGTSGECPRVEIDRAHEPSIIVEGNAKGAVLDDRERRNEQDPDADVDGSRVATAEDVFAERTPRFDVHRGRAGRLSLGAPDDNLR